MEDPTPSEGHGLRPVRVRSAPAEPVERLIAEDRTYENRVFRLGADPREQRLGRSHDLAQYPPISARFIHKTLQVDGVDLFEVEPFLGVHLEELLEFARAGDCTAPNLRGSDRGPRDPWALLGHRRDEGHEHRGWNRRDDPNGNVQLTNGGFNKPDGGNYQRGIERRGALSN